jgi:hypothetical protein
MGSFYGTVGNKALYGYPHRLVSMGPLDWRVAQALYLGRVGGSI